ncbi:MAG: VgrG-related protein [Candidatus Limnocylindrales bacterium]
MADPHAISATITVDGTPLDEQLVAHVDEVIVDEDLHRPAMFSMTLVDPDRDIVKRCKLRAGAKVEISVVGEGATGDASLLIGDVVTVECDYDDRVAEVVVRGYDATHRLHRGRRTRVFRDSTDSDIVTSVAGDAGLEVGEIESTSEVHEHVSQANQTDWEFLMGRARPLGLDLTVRDGHVELARRATSDDAPADAGADADPAGLDPRLLLFGFNLQAFHGRVSGADQVANVEVRGWDHDRKEPVVARVAAGSGAAGLAETDPSTLAGIFDSRDWVDVVTSVTSEREAEGVATALAERIGSAFAEAEGSAIGNTALRAGAAVRVSGVNEDFNGAYVLSHVRHVLDRRGYRTQFTVSGQHDRSLLGLIAPPATGNGHTGAGRVDATLGLVRGTVSENADPEKLGRVKVRFPWLDDQYSSNWAPVAQLGAGPESGTFFLPAVGDEVLVGFEHGQVDRPIVVGGLFNRIDQPPGYDQFLHDGAVTGRGIYSRNGHQITFHDADDHGGIVLRAVDGGQSSVVSIVLNALDKKLSIQCSGAVDITADGEVSLRGSKVTIQADGEMVLKGATIKLN